MTVAVEPLGGDPDGDARSGDSGNGVHSDDHSHTEGHWNDDARVEGPVDRWSGLSDRWNDLVDRSGDATVFHRAEALRALESHADAVCHPLVGYKGDQPVGLFPVFEVRRWPVVTAFSPPPAMRFPYLGPAMLDGGSPKQRKRERRRNQFVEAALEYVDDKIAPRLTHLRTTDRFDDLRPFLWNGFAATPKHTYLVDLDRGRDDLLAAFSRDARTNVRNADPDAYAIREGGHDGLLDILAAVRQRYESQGVDFQVTDAFVTDLADALPDETVRPYVCTVDGEFAGGILALDDGDTVLRWQGGVRTEGADLPVNDLLDWRVMTDAIDRGRSAYDLVGADDRRINRYKAKFAPELREYAVLERASPLVSLLARGYRRLK